MPSLIQTYIDHKQWGVHNVDEFHCIPRPPPQYFELLAEALQSNDKYIAYSAAAMLASWGDDQGLLWLLDYLPPNQKYLSPIHVHRLYDAEDYDLVANYVFNYAKSGGAQNLELQAYRCLLALVGRADYRLTQHLPVMLDLSPDTYHISLELFAAVNRCVQAGDGFTASMYIPVLASVRKADCLSVIRRVLSCKDTLFEAEDIPVVESMGVAISEFRDFQLQPWVTTLANSSDNYLRDVGREVIKANQTRMTDQACGWWQTRWQDPIDLLARDIVLYPWEDSQITNNLINIFWENYHLDIKCLRRIIALELQDIHANVNIQAIEEACDKYPYDMLSLSDKLLVSLLMSIMGKKQGITRLSSILQVLIQSSDVVLLQNSINGDDGAYDEIASAAYLYANKTGDWESIGVILTTLLNRYPELPSSVKIPAAVLDSDMSVLLSATENAHALSLNTGAMFQASKLLPALAKQRSPLWAQEVNKLNILASREELILDPDIFTVVSLHYGEDHDAKKNLAQLKLHQNNWISIFSDSNNILRP